MRQGRKKKAVKLLFIIIILTGILILLYPTVSNYIAEKQQENVIVGYNTKISETEQDVLEREWERAKEYNRNPENYKHVLNIRGDGVMGYISIPEIDVNIPIYHSATESSLNKGIGHVEQTGLPIGGKGNHPVLTGHRGLPNAQLFTRLDEMEIGDLFFIYVLDKTLAYSVDQIKVVLPKEVEKIKAQRNRDIVTLVTCTPYGVNTHRLLIQGERIPYSEKKEMIKGEDEIIRNKIIFLIIIIFTGIMILIYPIATHRMFCKNVNKQKKIFLQESKSSQKTLDILYKELVQRNETLYLEKQKNFSSQKSYETSDINLRAYGLKDNIIGFIVVPGMKITLPIYLGASEENMKRGAVHLTETSYPVGGENTNCVIAAHRGYSKTAMFREIDKLKKGDKIYVVNFRERLKYRVIGHKVILPEEIEKILIRDGKDMITLITCHPYRSNSKRYVVYCERC